METVSIGIRCGFCQQGWSSRRGWVVRHAAALMRMWVVVHQAFSPLCPNQVCVEIERLERG